MLLAGIAYRSLIFWDPSAERLPPVEGWFFSVAETYPQVVFALAASLIYRRRRQLARLLHAPGAPGLAILGLLPGALLFLWGGYLGFHDLLVGSLMCTAFGGSLLLFGVPFARAVALPIAVLVFAIPPLTVVINQVVYPLQLGTARFIAAVLEVTGPPLVREADLILLANDTFLVVEDCSGLRSILVLSMTVVAYVGFFPRVRLHATLLVAAAPVIAFFFNCVRATTLVLFPSSPVTTLHSVQGMAIFTAGMLLIYALDRALLRLLPRPTTPAPQARAGLPESAAVGGVARRPALVLAILLAAMAAASLWLPRWQPSDERRIWSIQFPSELDGWKRLRPLPVDSRFLGSVRFTWIGHHLYERDGEQVQVFIGSDDRRQRDRSVISAKNTVPGRGWGVEARGTLGLAPDGSRVGYTLARSGHRGVLSHYVYWGTGSLLGEIVRAALALDQSPLGRRDAVRFLRLDTRVEPFRGGEPEAEARLRHVFGALRDSLVGDAAPGADFPRE